MTAHAATELAQIMADLRRVAIVTRTAVGALQVSRHVREDAREVHVFHDDEAQALAYLRGRD